MYGVYMMFNRIERLKENFLNAKIGIDSERARLVTESYKETEGEPVVVRRARAFEKISKKMTIFIQPYELIVGNLASKPRYVPIFPETGWEWIEEELDGNASTPSFESRPVDTFQVTEETKQELREIFEYWKGKTLQDIMKKLCPEIIKKAIETTTLDNLNLWYSQDGHVSMDYPKVLNKGFAGVIKEAEETLKDLDITDPDFQHKRSFLEAVIICCKAVITYSKRYAKKAKEMITCETSPERKKELEKIAETCNQVPENPARSFYEACQSFFFTHIAVQIMDNGHSISPGRLDQYLYPFYKKSIESGEITSDQALELLECLWIKINEIKKVHPWKETHYLGGYNNWQNVTVGGQNSDGTDATNELSYLCLDATADVKLPEPSISVRYHDQISEKFMIHACKVIKLGLGNPAIFNDKVAISILRRRGIPLEDARNWALFGCVELGVPAKWGGRTGDVIVNMVKPLEMALNNGYDPRTGYRLCQGDFTTFKTFDEVIKAYKQQVDFFIKLWVALSNTLDFARQCVLPDPLVSALLDNCIKEARDKNEGGALYNFTGSGCVGAANLGNSLAAIKKLVFEDKVLSWAQLKHALDTNFEDDKTIPTGEEIRYVLLHKAPKYGNDVDYVDYLARDLTSYWAKNVENYRTGRRGYFGPAQLSVTANVPLGKATGATPDGRKSWDPLADGVSPAEGTDTNGPTAALKSVAKLEHEIWTAGTLLNQKFHPHVLKNESDIKKFLALIKTYFEMGGYHIQFNVISREKLIDAQENPEKYRTLVVRVAGYSAFFTSLDRDIQNHIIARTEHKEIF